MRWLVEMADTLVEDYDVIELLTGLADRCVSVLNASAAGVMLASPAGALSLVASSSEAMRILEMFELQTREGPCVDAFHTGRRVQHEDLRAESAKWPRFAPMALDLGFQSAFALPLRLRDSTVGALNVFFLGPDPMPEPDVVVAQAFADLATISVLQHRRATEARLLNEQLSIALDSRVVIEQAKGVISERTGIDLAESFAMLRTYARSHNLRLTDVAQSAVDGTLDPSAWAGAVRRRPPEL